MEQSLHCQIRIQGQLTSEWSDWFSGLCIENLPGGNGLLHGDLPDQAALYGVIDRLRDLGLVLLSVDCAEAHVELNPNQFGDKDPHPPVRFSTEPVHAAGDDGREIQGVRGVAVRETH